MSDRQDSPNDDNRPLPPDPEPESLGDLMDMIEDVLGDDNLHIGTYERPQDEDYDVLARLFEPMPNWWGHMYVPGMAVRCIRPILAGIPVGTVGVVKAVEIAVNDWGWYDRR